MVQDIKCIVCRNHRAKELYSINGFPIVQCEICGYIFCGRLPKSIDFTELYSQNYFHGDDYVNYIADEEVIKKNFHKFLSIVKSFQGAGRLLEVGSAYGFFLDKAREYFDCSGVEISKCASEYAVKKKGLKVFNMDLLDFDSHESYFDVVVMWDTIEHLEHPDLFLTKIHNLLKGEGYLFLTTGNIDAFVPRIRKQNWRLMKPPWHLHYFSPKTITRLLHRLDFDVRIIKPIGFYRSLDMIISKLVERIPKGNRIANNILNTFNIKSASIYLNLFDIMFVVAQKK